jgi:hypothetical protein
LDHVVDLGNNLALHEALSTLRIKALGEEGGTTALAKAPILPWHDVMGFGDDPALFSIEQSANRKVRIKYPVAVRSADMFRDEVSKLPLDIFLGGYEYDADQVLVIHDYDSGRFVPIVAQELIGYQHSGIRGFLGHVATVASLATPVGAARTAAGRAALIILDKVLPVAFLLIEENRLNIVKWFPKWGPRMIYYSDIAQKILMIYGAATLLRSGAGFFKEWKNVRNARKAMEATASAGAKADEIAAELEKQADQIFNEVDKFEASEAQISEPQQAPAGAATKPPDAPVVHPDPPKAPSANEPSTANKPAGPSSTTKAPAELSPKKPPEAPAKGPNTQEQVPPAAQTTAGNMASAAQRDFETARTNFDKVQSLYAERLHVGPGGEVHHAKELQLLKRYPGAFTEAELNAFKNMRGIPADLKNSLHQGAIRSELNQAYEGLDSFLKERNLTPGTPQYNQFVRDVIDRAARYIDDRYGQWFTDYGLILK